MKKKAMPKWYEGEMTADAPVMKKDKMKYMHDDMDYEMNGMMNGDMMNGDMMNGDMMNGDMMNGDMMNGDMNGMPVDHEPPMPMQMLLAHAYVPWQCYDNAFSPCEALMKGTLFPELWGVYPIPE